MPQLTPWESLPPGGLVPAGTATQAATGAWRTSGRPVLTLDRCVNCLLCWLYCPDSAVELDGTTVTAIDYEHCKGCELCVEVCPVSAIAMEPER
ncbi:MAG TPA: 4Fe-4S dicluster-binding protein [Gaiellaceae bacterium]|nr:4Fe-4S dicluster-binding protein [Gaiellaceae bacterium]